MVVGGRGGQRHKIYQLDAFTGEPFAGNPAAVCLRTGPAAADWMQAVAGEMNLSETAFLWPEEGGYRLRWFTPATEVDLCGHATLASAHVLWETGRLAAAQPAMFHTRSGRLRAERSGDEILMDLPGPPAEPVAEPAGLGQALGTPIVWLGHNRSHYLVELESEGRLRGLRPDFRALAQLDGGVIVTAASDSEEFDFVSRFFGPAVGIDEDPVTGSAHCCLGPFWSARLGRSELTGYQASARGGRVRLRVAGDRVSVGGRAVTVLRGELLVGPP